MEIVETDLDKPGWGKYLDLWWVKVILVLLFLRIVTTAYRWVRERRSRQKVMKVKEEMNQCPMMASPTFLYNKKLKENSGWLDYANGAVHEVLLFSLYMKDLLLSYII
jgi:hypothetical protein